LAVREVLRYPHPSLKRVARRLEPDETELVRRLAEDLVDTMRAHPRCFGLAAPQLDELLRVIVVDVSGHPKASASQGLLLLINPRIVHASGSEVAREGCLSIPDLTANVRRATQINLEGLTPSGNPTTLESTGFEARCLQHELDHLDGVLFLDRVASLKDDVFRRRPRPPEK
jgi:peptide deformylase